MKQCKCPVGSPFHWWEQKSETAWKLNHDKVASLTSSKVVQKSRDRGIEPGRIYGISSRGDEHIIMFDAHEYSARRRRAAQAGSK